jgi:SRSO17 transposase
MSNGELKYFVSNDPEDTPAEQFRKLASTRWPIEQSFQERGTNSGLDHYAGRSWNLFHRHFFLVFILHRFLQMMRKNFSAYYEQLS